MSDEVPVADENGGIRYLTAYTPENPPQSGDVVWGPWDGKDVHVIGRMVWPSTTVILGEDDDEEDDHA